ncbi:MAG: dethiobiotin synthase [Rhodothermales bacterium]
MADGLFLMGTDRGVGKTILGVALVALLRKRGVDATLMTPISTGGSIESPIDLLKQVGVDDDPALTMPIKYETLAAPYVASLVERRPVDLERIFDAYEALKDQGHFVVVEGGSPMVPIARNYMTLDLLRDFELPALVIGRAGRGTLNHTLMTVRIMLAMGVFPQGVLLNGYGQYGEGFAESLNPDVLADLIDPIPVLATLEWRPEFQDDVQAIARSLAQHDDLVTLLDGFSTV